MAARWLAFHLTDRCDLNCQHCLRDPGKKPLDIDPALLSATIRQAAQTYGTAHVALTGGEPTLHPQFVDIVDDIGAAGLTWHVVTNGLRLPALLQKLDGRQGARAALTTLNISIDGADADTHDKIRGAGTYMRAMAGIAAATARDIPIVLQLAVNARNEHQLEAFALNAALLGASRISFAWLQPTGTSMDAELFIPAERWWHIRARIERLAANLSVPVSMPEGFPNEQSFHVCPPYRSDTLHVDVHGRLTLCCQLAGTPSGRHSDIAGDLTQTPLLKAHRALLEIIHDAQTARLDGMDDSDPWNAFPCNACLKHFDRPHWREGGTAGPAAARPRWRGAWALETARRATRNPLPVLE